MYNVDAPTGVMLGEKTVSVFLKISFRLLVAFPEGHFDLVKVNKSHTLKLNLGRVLYSHTYRQKKACCVLLV